MIIRVEPSLLQGLAAKMQDVGGGVSALGSNAASAAEGAPSYDGQFGPLVWPIGAEANSRTSGFTTQLVNLSYRLGRKAVEFERADNTTINGLISTSMTWPAVTEFLAQWSKITGIPVATLERSLRLGALFGGTSSYGLLIGMVMWNGLYSSTSLTFSGILKPSWWPSWLPWAGKQPPSQNIVPPNTTTSPQQKSKFGELIEKANKEKEQADLEAKKLAEQKVEDTPKPKYINQYPSREDDGSFLVGQEKSDSCSMASTRMALEQATGVEARESDLRDASSALDGGYQDNSSKWGTNPSTLDDLVNNKYGDVATASYNDPGTQTVADLEAATNNGKGTVVSVKNSEWFGSANAHSVSVVGVTTENGQQAVLINDPWPPGEGKRLSIPAGDFEKAWYGDAMYISQKIGE